MTVTVTTTDELLRLADDYAKSLRSGNVDAERVVVLHSGIKSFLWWAQSQLSQRTIDA